MQWTTGTPAARAAASRRAVAGTTPTLSTSCGQLGKARQVAHHAALELHGEHGRPSAAHEIGEVDGHGGESVAVRPWAPSEPTMALAHR